MKAFWVMAAVGLGLMGSLAPVSAQRGGDYGYGGRDDRDRGYGGRDREYGGRDRDDDRGRGSRGREAGFDEREYLRCNPDVRRAVSNGQMESAAAHYKVFGRREGRRLSC
ncbi:MAG TPA: hypothetical protein VF641_04275 [Methylobacterium sp.]